MPRQPLAIGGHGEIYTKRESPDGVKPEKWRASARYRAYDGRVRQLERWGPTENKAKNALRTALADRLGGNGNAAAGAQFEDVATHWLDQIQRRRSGTTYDRYKSRLDNHILPAVGGLRIRECTAARFKAVLDELESSGMEPSTLRGLRTVLSGVMQEAVDRELIAVNPVRNMRRIEGGRTKKPAAYDAAQLRDFLARIDGDKTSRDADLPDFIRFLFGTGARFGEALALRWKDVNLSEDESIRATDAWGDTVTIPPKSVWINGNIVDVRGKGLVRNDGKTFKSNRVIVMPGFLHMLLLVRKPVGVTEDEPVFPSGTLGWRHPSNVQRSVRRLRIRIRYPNFTTHIGRKTVATVLDQAGHTAREIAAILGHARPSMTQDVYMARGEANPRAASTLGAIHQAG